MKKEILLLLSAGKFHFLIIEMIIFNIRYNIFRCDTSFYFIDEGMDRGEYAIRTGRGSG